MIILIADDERGVQNSLCGLLEEDHEVLVCADGAAALEILERTSVDLVITDHQMPKLTGLELIKTGRDRFPSTSFILMTAYGSVEQAVQALQLGAEDYFTKPFEFDEVLHRVARIAELRAWKIEKVLKLEKKSASGRLIGKSRFVQQAQEFVSKVSTVQSPVLILGPSGSGKEVLARSIHEAGPRADRPFIAINCASLSEQLMESELFGHEKGAFTGATTSKPGKFELASGGTIFLDEIGELSQNVQAKLLRVLQEKEFFRVGGVRQIKTGARVIAATHRPLKEMVKQGSFREDLYFRINVLAFEMAPLKNRSDDLPQILDFFWTKHSQDLGRRVQLSAEARSALLSYSYPGNIRELQNILERMIVLGPQSGLIGRENLPPELLSSGATDPSVSAQISAAGSLELGLSEWLDAQECLAIQQAMDATRHNQVRAAELLRITRGALQYKLKKYRISPAEAA